MNESTKNESSRVSALRGYRLLDTASEPEFDEIVREAADALDAPIALISLVDENRQWFKARVGLDVDETPRSISFCAYAIQGPTMMVVPDATCDDRFRDNPLVTDDPSIRFYAGVPLESGNGHRLGTLCVLDREPRDGVGEDQRMKLETLARKVMSAFAERKKRLAANTRTTGSADG